MAIVLHHGTDHGIGHHLHSLGKSGEWIADQYHHISETVSVWQQRLASRHQLARLDERELQDIGLTKSDVWQEIDKPFWRP